MEESAIYPIGVDDPVFNMNMEIYKKPPTSYDCFILNHFNDEISTLEEYEGRELYELIQNADDAGSSNLKIELIGTTLIVSNDGNRPFTQDGYASIMRPNQSTKRDEKYIGCKGLGFRSVLNWCNSLTIRSLLSPYSPNGLECEFSQEIALRKYDELLKIWGTLDDKVVRIFKGLMNESNRKSPVPILAIPEVRSWKPVENFTTQILLNLFPDIVEKVKENIDTLHCSQFFLFLHNLRSITIVTDGFEKTLSWKRKIIDNHEFVFIYNSAFKNSPQKWLVKRLTENKISVAAARRIDNSVTAKEHHSYCLHSFFPTKIKLGYGCVCHATIKLDKSRNHMLDTTPSRVLECLGQVVVGLSDIINNLNAKNPTWDGYDIVRSTIDMENVDSKFKVLNEILLKARINHHICPSVDQRFIPLITSIHITESFSKFAETKRACVFFCNVLKSGFKEMDIAETYSLENPLIENFANPALNPNLSDEERVSYISLIARISHKRQSRTTLKLLIDQNGKLITVQGFILTGRNETIPSILQIQVVKEEIVLGLKEVLAQEIEIFDPGEKIPNRQLARYLGHICHVGYNDFNGVKALIFSESRKQRSKNQEVELVRYLFNQWKSNISYESGTISNKGFVVPEDEILYLLDKDLKPRQICDLIYGEEHGQWAPCVADWKSELKLTDEEAFEFRSFLINSLHMASAVPMRFVDWANEPKGYLEKFCPTTIGCCKRQEVKSDIRTNKRMTLVVDEEFVRTKSSEELVHLAISDKNFFHTIYPEPRGEFTLFYFYRCLNPLVVSMSPCAFIMYEKLRNLSNYVVNKRKWLGTEMIDVTDLSSEEYGRFVKLAILMGAKGSDSELTPKEIYARINETPKEGHAELYKHYKDLLKASYETIVLPQLNLWCTKNGKPLPDKVPAQECYYWDNTPPKAILTNFPLFDIGKREGEVLVQKIFGVNPISSIQCKPKENAFKSLTEMSEDARSLINDRLKYFLAYRCENIRVSESRRDQIKASLATIKNINFVICSHLEYKINSECFTLEKGEYIIDTDKRYWLVLENCNLPNYSLGIDTLSSMLCNSFRIEEKNWKSKFKDLLMSDLDELEKRFLCDFDIDYIDEILDVINGISQNTIETKPKITFSQMSGIIHKIGTYELNHLYNEYKETYSEQSTFFEKWQKKEFEISSRAEAFFEKITPVKEIIDMEDELLVCFNLKRTDVESLERPIPLPEYESWIRETFGDNYTVQQYNEIHSMSYFPNNLQKMQDLWRQIQENESPEVSANEQETESSDSNVVPKIQCVSLESLHKPEAATGEISTIKHRKNLKVQKERVSGETAEKLVYKYLYNQGFNPIPRSSILDPNVKDIRHYDIEYFDNNGKQHYVEVKATSDGNIYFSEQEFAFASKHPENYDLFIVYNGEINVLEKAYSRIKQTVTPEKYRVLFSPQKI